MSEGELKGSAPPEECVRLNRATYDDWERAGKFRKEGELKKQMWNADTAHDPTIYMFEIIKVLDEAKKDSPMLPPHTINGRDYLTEITMWRNWYKKWFGE